MKRKWPRLVWIFSSLRFPWTIRRTVSLIALLERAGRRDPATGPRSGEVVLFNMIRTYVPIQLVIECALALKLRARGYDVHILYDDNILYHHETLTCNAPKPFRPYYRMRYALSLRLLRSVPVLRDMLTPYSQFVRRDDVPELKEPVGRHAATYTGLTLEPFVRASLVRFFLSAPDIRLLEAEPEYPRARTMFVRNAIVSLAVAQKVYDQLRPKLLITSHGIYSSWGTFMEFMMSRGVRSISYGLNGYAADSLDFAVDDIAAGKSDGGYLDRLTDGILNDALSSSDISTRVTELMTRRRRGSSDDIARLGVSATRMGKTVGTILDEHRAAGRDIFALFPNVMWDNATTFERWNRVFESPAEWLVETVKYFAGRDDKTLVIRIHPAERSWMPPRKSVLDILRLHLDSETMNRDNIVIIPADEPLSSYSLFPCLRGGIVYNGTIGIELILAHVALIVGAQAAYSEHGFTAELHGRDDYFAAFENTDAILRHQEDNLDRALLFAYEYFFLHGVPLKLLSPQRQAVPNLAESPDEIWKDPNLEHVVAVITGRRRFFQDHWRTGVT